MHLRPWPCLRIVGLYILWACVCVGLYNFFLVLQAAAAAAQQAEAAAQASAVQAGQAEQAAQAVARALLVSKRAEIEAADMLEKPKNPKEADPVAAELLKVCTCGTIPKVP